MEDLNPYAVELEDIARRTKYAQMLREQAMQPLQGAGMAGRTVAPISWAQGAAQMLKAAGGGYGDTMASQERKGVVDRYQKDSNETLSRALSIAKGGDTMGGAQALASGPNRAQQAIGYGAIGNEFLPKTAPKTVDLGDRIGLMDQRGQIIGYLPKQASPDASLREKGAQTRHEAPSGSAVLQNQGAMQRHQTPSGSAILGERGAMARHGTASGSALVAAETARRGQDISAQTSRRGQDMNVNPDIQRMLAGVKAEGKEMGEARAQATLTLPAAATKVEQAVSIIDKMIGSKGKTLAPGQAETAPHSGFESTVGWTWTPGMRFVEGSSEADFMALLNQASGGAFMEAYQTLKGGGQITEIEGKKATDAITRMGKSQSEAEFIEAAREFEGVLRQGLQNMKRRAGDKPGGTPKIIDFNSLSK